MAVVMAEVLHEEAEATVEGAPVGHTAAAEVRIVELLVIHSRHHLVHHFILFSLQEIGIFNLSLSSSPYTIHQPQGTYPGICCHVQRLSVDV